jgi:hypothetical protein
MYGFWLLKHDDEHGEAKKAQSGQRNGKRDSNLVVKLYFPVYLAVNFVALERFTRTFREHPK